MASPIGASPDPRIAAGALRYQRANGLAASPVNYGHVVMPSSATQAISQAYGRLQHFDQGAVPAYRQMRDEVGRQFDFMTRPEAKGGLGISVESTAHDPYGQHSVHDIVNEIRSDVNNHGRMQVLSTKSTGGHPLFSDDENDMFRAVHDVFGHLGAGRGVDRHGEEAAFQKHSAMFSPLAQRALATETRGQNSWLHRNGDFPEQKVALLPTHLSTPQFQRFTPDAADHRQAVEDNRNQGLRPW